MRQSSMYVRTQCHFRPLMTSSMNRENTPDAVASPIGMRVYSYKPSGVANAVRGLLASDRGTCQKAATMSMELKYRLPFNAAKESSTLGRGYASLLTILFSCRKSTTNLTPPFGLGTSSAVLAYGLQESLMMPMSFCFLICFANSTRDSGLTLMCLAFMSGFPVSSMWHCTPVAAGWLCWSLFQSWLYLSTKSLILLDWSGDSLRFSSPIVTSLMWGGSRCAADSAVSAGAGVAAHTGCSFSDGAACAGKFSWYKVSRSQSSTSNAALSWRWKSATSLPRRRTIS